MMVDEPDSFSLCHSVTSLYSFTDSLSSSFQGVRAVLAQSFEKLHRKQLVGMGILPLQFLPEQSAVSLELSGKERFSIALPEGALQSPRQQLLVQVGPRRSLHHHYCTSRPPQHQHHYTYVPPLRHHHCTSRPPLHHHHYYSRP